jgi:16S rRNA (cytidine1402-2'-O)-methyltransferase
MASVNGQGFAFHGYLPVKPEARTATLRRVEADSRSIYAQIFIETPYRNTAMLAALIAICKPNALVRGRRPHAREPDPVSRPILDWRNVDAARYAKRPAIFILQA